MLGLIGNSEIAPPNMLNRPPISTIVTIAPLKAQIAPNEEPGPSGTVRIMIPVTQTSEL